MADNYEGEVISFQYSKEQVYGPRITVKGAVIRIPWENKYLCLSYTIPTMWVTRKMETWLGDYKDSTTTNFEAIDKEVVGKVKVAAETVDAALAQIAATQILQKQVENVEQLLRSLNIDVQDPLKPRASPL